MLYKVIINKKEKNASIHYFTFSILLSLTFSLAFFSNFILDITLRIKTGLKTKDRSY